MDDTQNNRLYGVVGLVVMVVVAVAIVVLAIQRSGPQDADFVVGQVSEQLRGATVDLIGYAPDGEESLDDSLALARRSVDDMTTLDEPAYVETYDRTPDEQAAVVGRWLGLAGRELGGDMLGLVSRTTLELVDRVPDGLDRSFNDALDAAAG